MKKHYDELVEINCKPIFFYYSDWNSIIDDSESDKSNVLLNLIKHHRSDVYKIYSCQKSFKSKYHFLINEREKTGIKNGKNPSALTDYSQTIYDFHEN